MTTRRVVRSLLAVAATTVLAATAGGSATAAAPFEATRGGAATASVTGSATGELSVVVMADAGALAAVERRAADLGIRITLALGIVNGFAAQGSADALDRLAAAPGVRSVTPDLPVTPMAIEPSLGYDPADSGSLSAVTQIVGAQAAWAKGYTGAGIDVAVIDTGVAPVPGLDAPGKVVTGPDLSFDAPGATTPGLDAYGHGTFMAGLIAGRDQTATASSTGCTTCLNSSGYSDTTKYVGVAPDARIVNVKVGAVDGATDVSQVIAAIDWVTQHARDPGMNIRVLNLSFGTKSSQLYTLDPLAQAAEQAWKHGIVVVAAAGNDGPLSGPMASPAYDPFLIAVGGQDTLKTITTADDRVASFAQHGTTARNVDVIAPATSVLGLRVPGSFVDTLAGNAGQVGTRFQRGSGTSQAAAIVSGMAALLAQRYPTATPDQIKAQLTGTATPLPLVVQTPTLDAIAAALGMKTKDYLALLNSINLQYSGRGMATVRDALTSLLTSKKQSFTASSGAGTLQASRGGVYVVSNGVSLTGEKDIFGRPFVSTTMAAAQVKATAWTGGVWNGSRWTGDGWTGSRWTAAAWTGSDWAGSRWTGSRWTGMTWDGSRWSGSGWNGSRWTGAGWTGSRWSSSSWS